jgi:hypothetical protein
MLFDKSLTFSEFIVKAKEVFRVSNEVFVQRYDETWGEQIDLDEMNEIVNGNKLFLVDIRVSSNLPLRNVSTFMCCFRYIINVSINSMSAPPLGICRAFGN